MDSLNKIPKRFVARLGIDLFKEANYKNKYILQKNAKLKHLGDDLASRRLGDVDDGFQVEHAHLLCLPDSVRPAMQCHHVFKVQVLPLVYKSSKTAEVNRSFAASRY